MAHTERVKSACVSKISGHVNPLPTKSSFGSLVALLNTYETNVLRQITETKKELSTFHLLEKDENVEDTLWAA